MKYLSLLIFIVFISSCGSVKQVVENSTSEKTEEVAKVEVETEIESEPEPEIETELKIEKKIEVEEIPIEPNENVILEDIEILKVFNYNSWNNLLIKHVSKTGNVNYKAFKKDRKQLSNYITSLSENLPTESWTKNDKLAYWINAYNAMTVDLIISNYPIKSIKDIKDPWDQRLWKLGKKWYNLNEIEHQILRKMNEPRIHFAIVCASFSCPKLQNKAFTASNLEEQLTESTKEFLADSKRNSISQNHINLSKIFKWFSKDFKQNGSLIDFLNKYSTIKISAKANKSFKDYNWDLNE